MRAAKLALRIQIFVLQDIVMLATQEVQMIGKAQLVLIFIRELTWCLRTKKKTKTQFFI